jgi:hypothetical protein
MEVEYRMFLKILLSKDNSAIVNSINAVSEVPSPMDSFQMSATPTRVPTIGFRADSCSCR